MLDPSVKPKIHHNYSVSSVLVRKKTEHRIKTLRSQNEACNEASPEVSKSCLL